ncbi:enoyl-CoA hydratase/isomerase family protein [Pseudoruegeria sp. SHC-113]|uniref:enoyl-CoA hydratase/isomerase family protein n=1 Tax=Pseudoruegeria sp. SHC-113 TaxID=2855439 RepID=UPI0021BA8917|nr:enoyl-CoA hydratase/isomerase family protein [Pseudoruegeria sp. SHC-113]MCT8160700.1 enoyl-CoA hydratase/isomerase family protein [Pseudoruegeria sp. SHC-113]
MSCSAPLVTFELLKQEGGAPFGVVSLNAPASHNRLTPALLADFNAALDRAETAGAAVLLIRAEGAQFCTGGDVSLFLAAARENRAETFADTLVGALHALLLRLIAFPGPVITCAQGAITGGGAGLLFAADVTLLSEDAFLQPYYGTVGFAPDGGWTALLPGRIGAQAAGQWLLQDRRVTAHEAAQLGLSSAPCAAETLSNAGYALARSLSQPARLHTARATKALLWTEAAQAAAKAGLAAEQAAFREAIARPHTRAAMEAFCSQRQTADV